MKTTMYTKTPSEMSRMEKLKNGFLRSPRRFSIIIILAIILIMTMLY